MKSKLVNGELTVSLHEDLISTSVARKKSQFQEILHEHKDIKTMILDIKEVDLIDSQGLNLLIGIYQECQKRSIKFRITGCSRANEKLFSYVKMKERFGIEANV